MNISMVRTVTKILIVWLFLAAINFELLHLEELQLIDIDLDTSVFFPISVFKLEFHASGLKYGLVFLIVLSLSLKHSSKFKPVHLWFLTVIFIVLGNLSQGSIDEGFYKPFFERGIQYYDDALKVVDWRLWLANFTELQDSLLTHSKTHPPFAVLLHYGILEAAKGRVGILASAFALISSFSPIIFWYVLKTIRIPVEKCNILTILFSVVPAYNIYSCVSLDGIILTGSLLFLYGIVRIIKIGIHFQGLIFYLAGMILVNALTYGGIFLFLVTFLVGARNYWMHRKTNFLYLLGSSIVLCIACNELIGDYFGYSHFLGFIQASALENSEGFRGFTEPINYFITRIENFSEIALFFSLGCFVALFHPDILRLRFLEINDDWSAFTLFSIFSVLLFCFAGAYKTGETARACLFIYPYLLLAFRNMENPPLTFITMFAGIQTIIMQLFGDYCW